MNPALIRDILQSGRSWWQARYSDGKVVGEWETSLLLPNSITAVSGRTSRWEEVPKKGMVGLRLLCPKGKEVLVGEIENNSGMGQFIQLKVGGVTVGGNRFCNAHIIGILEDLEGNCHCRAWEHNTRRLVTFDDNVFNMQYMQIGRLNLHVQGIRI